MRMIARIDSLAQAEEKRRVQEAHKETIRQKEQARNISFVIGGLLLLIAGGLYSRLHYIRKSKARLQREKDRSREFIAQYMTRRDCKRTQGER